MEANIKNNGQGDRFYAANQGDFLFARYVDNIIYDRFHEDLVQEFLFSTYGGTFVTKFSPEIHLLSRLLFYVPSILTHGASPGQHLAGFIPVKTRQVTGINKEKFYNPSKQSLLLLSLLYSILPYLNDRRDIIFSKCMELYGILTSPESLSHEQDNTGDGQNRLGNTDELERDSDTAEDTDEVKTFAAQSIFHKAWKAFGRTWQVLFPSRRSHFDSIESFVQDIVRYLFLAYGRFLEIPPRIVGIQYLSRFKSPFNAKLKVISWLVFFRLSLLAFYGARVYLTNLDDELNTPHESSQQISMDAIQSLPSDTRSIFPTISNDFSDQQQPPLDNRTDTSATRKTCIMCMDTLRNPSVIPCGHIYCWDCLVSYALSTAVDPTSLEHLIPYRPASSTQEPTDPSSDPDESPCPKCPICRALFRIQDVRPLFNFE